jgi:hypothetical protein
MQFEVMPNGKAPVLGTGKSRFDSGHLDCDLREQVNPGRRERLS